MLEGVQVGFPSSPNILNIEGFFSSKHTLSGWFKITGSIHGGFLTNVYGPPRAEQKVSFLDLLVVIKDISDDKPWILGGDFNLIMNLEEKKGGIRNLNLASVYFNVLIDTLDLIDVRTSNGIFAWNNKKVGDRGIACWLDLFLIYESIMLARGELRAVVLPPTASDH